MRRVLVVALNADRVPSGGGRVNDAERVRAHDERIVRREGEVLGEGGRLIDVVSASRNQMFSLSLRS